MKANSLKLEAIKILALAGCCNCILAVSLAAPGQQGEKSGSPPADATADKEVTKPQNLYPQAEEVSGNRLSQKLEEYLKERKWVLHNPRANPNSAYLEWGEATIQAKPDDLKFGQSRVLAYETALMDAKSKFVRFQQRVTTTDTVRKLFQDSGDISEEDAAKEVSRLKVIWQKILALTEAKLDTALEKAGVDPAQFRNKPLEIKRKLLQDSIRRSINVRALASVAGVRTLATFEDLNAVGVLIVYSDNQRDLARSMLFGRTVARSDPAKQHEDILKQIDAACPKGAKDLADVFGVRVMTDENGDRVLVSFGQWSPAVTQADSRFRRDTAIKAGRLLAQDLADGALTDFVNSTLALQSDSSVWQNAELNRIISPKQSEEVESLTIGETLNTVLKQQGKATLQGVMVLKEWTANHPETGHLLVGHILMWSPTSRDAAINGLNVRASAKPGAGPARTNENKIRTSPDFDKDSDL